LGWDTDGPVWNARRVCIHGRLFGKRQSELYHGDTGTSRWWSYEIDKHLTHEGWIKEALCGYHRQLLVGWQPLIGPKIAINRQVIGLRCARTNELFT
jgi:hypothetical protein